MLHLSSSTVLSFKLIVNYACDIFSSGDPSHRFASLPASMTGHLFEMKPRCSHQEDPTCLLSFRDCFFFFLTGIDICVV